MNTNQLLNWWQHLPEKMNPVVFDLGWFKLQYYGLMYIVAITIVYSLVSYRINREPGFSISKTQVRELSLNMVVGIIIGGRLGYVLFYNFTYYLQYPWEIILPFEITDQIHFTGISGMSYHGGLIGVIIASWLYIRKNKISFKQAADLYTPAIPLGYTFGRLGNFINGELFGRATTSWIGMYFPEAPGNRLRHPSQLYEAFFEGIFLFSVLWLLRNRKMPEGAMLSLYLIGYGVVRFCIEFFREPDEHLGFMFLQLSMGQLLCGLMMIAGMFLYLYFKKSGENQSRHT